MIDNTTDIARSDLINKIMNAYVEKNIAIVGGEQNFHAFIESMLSMQGTEFFNQLSETGKFEPYADSLYKLWLTFSKWDANPIPTFSVVQNQIAEHQTFFSIISQDYNYILRSLLYLFKNTNIKYINMMHPVLRVRRSADGALLDVDALHNTHQADYHFESIVHCLILSPLSEDALEKLQNDVRDLFLELTTIDAGIKPTEQKMQLLSGALYKNTEQGAFLNWVKNGFYYFYGYRYFNIKSSFHSIRFSLDEHSVQGLFSIDKFNQHNELLPTFSKENLEAKLLLSKSPLRSHINNGSRYDSIELPALNENGEIKGLYQFIGSFTPDFFSASPSIVPIARTKVQSVFNQFGFDLQWYNGKLLKAIVDSIPLDFFFQLDVSTLTQICQRVLKNQKSISFYIRGDVHDPYVTILVFLPVEKYSYALKSNIREYFETELKGIIRSEHVHIEDQLYTRMVFVLDRYDGKKTVFDHKVLQAGLNAISESWEEKLLKIADYDLAQHVFDLFPKEYQEDCSPYIALQDFSDFQKMTIHNKVIFNMYAVGAGLELHMFNPKGASLLSEILPILEKFGLEVVEESTYCLNKGDIDRLPILQFFFIKFKKQPTSVNGFKERFLEAIDSIWAKHAENDDLNQLITQTQLTLRDVILIRSFIKFSSQTGLKYSYHYIVDILISHPQFISDIVQCFDYKFNPERYNMERAEELVQACELYCADLEKVDEDIILRHIISVLNASIRTNYYQTIECAENHIRKDYISIKFSSRKILNLPAPAPLYEIFVYSSEMEGIHLRGGKVARGGLRWSDRAEDFRYEILALMKAQMVKNSVIIPLGSKGGFIVKNFENAKKNGATREELHNLVVTSYKKFISALLDITDNLQDHKIIKPQNCICHDDDDPYLVVAADKGTATFSDIANSVSQQYGFWLGDAFASGGSKGYDHKKMGITARGSWVSVKHHFLEKDIDVQKDPFTVVGIGDMSGDVFGNGMLQSHKIRLLAAFNHEHIFIDPTPDENKSYAERKRLFDNPQLKWVDYEKEIISKGGGVYSRFVKSIPITPEMHNAFGINAKITTMLPDELIKCLLTAPVDLLYFGGIGTFIKASHESHADTQDRSNDAIRVNAKNIQAKVIGEGANLGITQLGRIEFSLNGGRINMDAIDNSAGVDCSDHEVNLKIFFNQLIQQKALSQSARDELLVEMEKSVAELVLQDTKQQTFLLSVMEKTSLTNTSAYEQLIDDMSKNVDMPLNRAVEFLPDQEELTLRHSRGLSYTRPELAIITSYSKIQLYQKLLKCLDDREYDQYYLHYFPEILVKRFSSELMQHPLKHEILCTVLSNYLINRCGANFLNEIISNIGVDYAQIIKAFFKIVGLAKFDALWEEVVSTDEISIFEKYDAWEKITQSLRQMIFSYLRHRHTLEKYDEDQFSMNIKTVIATFTKECEVYGCILQRRIELLSYFPMALEVSVNQLDGNILSVDSFYDYFNKVSSKLDFAFLFNIQSENKFDKPWELGTKHILDDDLLNAMTSCVIHAMNAPSLEVWFQEHAQHLKLYRRHMKLAKSAYTTNDKNLGIITYAVKQLGLLNRALQTKLI
jgi:glutamate dehydrogenase